MSDSTYIIPLTSDSIIGMSDSLIDVNELKCEVVQAEKEEVNNFFGTVLFANLVSAGALIITLVIFIIQSMQARKEQKRTINENWYLIVILQPNMEELDEFYKEEANQLEALINKLKSLNISSIFLDTIIIFLFIFFNISNSSLPA